MDNENTNIETGVVEETAVEQVEVVVDGVKIQDNNNPNDLSTTLVSDEEEPSTEEVPIEETTPTEEVPIEDNSEAIKNELVSKGLDFDKFAQEYENDGQLSNESLQALEKAGYPKPIVDAYIAGLEAKAEKFTNSVKALAGGDKGWEELATFIKAQGEATTKAFNDVLNSGNIGAIKLAVEGLQAQKVAKYGTSNKTLLGSNGNMPSNTGYETQEEVVKAMSDKRYGKDANYTRTVQMKLSKTNCI